MLALTNAIKFISRLLRHAHIMIDGFSSSAYNRKLQRGWRGGKVGGEGDGKEQERGDEKPEDNTIEENTLSREDEIRDGKRRGKNGT